MSVPARPWLRAEGAAVALLAGAALYVGGQPLPVWLAVLIVIAPDVTFAFYAAGPRIGGALYNAAHSYVGPAALLAAGLWSGGPHPAFALLWAVHIAVDRAIGYGLKGASFYDTHLGRIGRA